LYFLALVYSGLFGVIFLGGVALFFVLSSAFYIFVVFCWVGCGWVFGWFEGRCFCCGIFSGDWAPRLFFLVIWLGGCLGGFAYWGTLVELCGLVLVLFGGFSGVVSMGFWGFSVAAVRWGVRFFCFFFCGGWVECSSGSDWEGGVW